MNKQNIKASYFSTIKISVLNITKLRNTTQKRRPDISYEDFVEVDWQLLTRGSSGVNRVSPMGTEVVL
jgi:hypothetical protein